MMNGENMKFQKNHLEIEKLLYCKVCKEKYNFSGCGDRYTPNEYKRTLAREQHNQREYHKQNQEFFDLYFS